LLDESALLVGWRPAFHIFGGQVVEDVEGGFFVHVLEFLPLELVEQFAGALPVVHPGFDFGALFFGHSFMLAQGEGFAKCGGGQAGGGYFFGHLENQYCCSTRPEGRL